MTVKTVWKTGGSYVVALNAQEVNHLQLWRGNRVHIQIQKGKKIGITRYPKHKPRKPKPHRVGP